MRCFQASLKKVAFLSALFFYFILPAIGQEQPYYFAMITDTQFGMHTGNKGFDQETANYEFAVATINRLKPEFVIILGDLVNQEGDMDQIHEFLRVSRKIDPFIPVYYVAGNHDVGAVPTTQLLDAYRETFGKDYYSFREGPIYGIVLNSSMMVAPQKVEDEYKAQLSWLKGELQAAKASDAQQIIVFQHHPYFMKEANEDDSYGNVPLERRRPCWSFCTATTYNMFLPDTSTAIPWARMETWTWLWSDRWPCLSARMVRALCWQRLRMKVLNIAIMVLASCPIS